MELREHQKESIDKIKIKHLLKCFVVHVKVSLFIIIYNYIINIIYNI